MEMEKDKIVFKGSHPDSLYRVSADNGVSTSKVTRVLRVLRWPAALVAVCVALAVFVYFLMPDNLESRTVENVTYYDPAAAGPRTHPPPREHHDKKPLNVKLGTKTSEIDFYDAENNKNTDLHTAVDTIADSNPKRKLPVPPVFPTHLTPEVQYGNEKADAGNLRTPKLLEDTSTEDSTLKPHITQKPEKPLAIYFKNGSSANTGLITRPETFNDFTNNDNKQLAIKNVEYAQRDKSQSHTEHLGHQGQHEQGADKYVPLEVGEFYARRPNVGDISFTSGHSKLFGISIEDAEKMKSTTQSSLYNTRVSPTLPTWRDGDDTTTKKYPSNIYSEVQCHSTRMALCRGILPYDLAEAPAKIGNVEVTSLLSQIDYLVATNCSDRVRHFMCALLEPECNPPPYPTKKPCYGLCKAIADACEGQIPAELTPLFNCKQYSRTSCVAVKTPCFPREFSCNDGSCVPRDWMCDGTKDCPSGEDEATCVKCDQSEYRCSTGECILKRWLCDGYSDCPDGEDEHVETCGTRTPHTVIADAHEPGSLHAAADTHEPGEESAGSAPAPAVRRPNRVQHKQKIANQRIGENESSKELLITSDSNNSLKRNLTRRPLPPRLSHYYPVQPTRPSMIEISKALVHEPTPTKQKLKKPEEEKVAEKPVPEKESIEDVNMGDLGFFDEFEKESKDQQKEPVEQKPEPPIKIARFGVPQPKPPKQTAPNRVWPAPTQPTPVDKMANNFERVIDGAALLRKAAAEHAAEVAEDVSMNDTFAYVDKDEIQGPDPALTLPRVSPNSPVTKTGPAHRPGPVGPKVSKDKGSWSRAHASPCPSGELRCVDGRCITLAQLCDGTIDCTDHADEDNCYT